MSYEIRGHMDGTEVAAVDLSTHQYKFVQLTSSGVNICTDTVTQDCFGVLQNKPAAGEPCEVMTSGVSKVVAGAAVTKGAQVTSDASGRAVPYTSPATYTVGSIGKGIAKEAASGAGEIIAVLIKSVA